MKRGRPRNCEQNTDRCLLSNPIEAQRLKLALVTRRYPPLIGGAEKVLSYLAKAFAAEGAEVTVVTSDISGSTVASHEEVLVSVEGDGGAKAGLGLGQLSVTRLPTSRLRFWGTWRYMRNLEWWFRQNAIDLAYVSMLKHDAYVATKVGRANGFPVVLRPEGAGPTGDIAWQSWGNFGRRIGIQCRQADAFVAISKPIADELREAWQTGTMRPRRKRNSRECSQAALRIIAISNG